MKGGRDRTAGGFAGNGETTFRAAENGRWDWLLLGCCRARWSHFLFSLVNKVHEALRKVLARRRYGQEQEALGNVTAVLATRKNSKRKIQIASLHNTRPCVCYVATLDLARSC